MIIFGMNKKLVLILMSGLLLSGCLTSSNKEAVTVTPTGTENISTEQLVGNDEDEHGCKASAGYSWCEIKQKCLRTWEEKCEEEIIEENVKEAVTKLLIEKYNWEEDKVSVQVNKEVGDFASGSVGFGSEIGGGGWLVKRIEGKWKLIWDGNGAVDCENLRTEHQFPDEILKPGFCD
jgi:hypothetical protein